MAAGSGYLGGKVPRSRTLVICSLDAIKQNRPFQAMLGR